MINSEPLTLSVETATLAGSVALTRGAAVLASSNGDPTTSHSNTLILEIRDVLTQANLSLNEVDLLAVASGPGSFTGLRIGIATVKALAETLTRPCIGVPTLEAIALAAGASEATVTLMPAGRGEVFVQMFSVDSAGRVRALDQPAHVPPLKALQRYSDQATIRFAGPGAKLHLDLIREVAHHEHYDFRPEDDLAKGWRIASPAVSLARYIALLGTERFTQPGSYATKDLKALYVRPSDAELKA